MRDRGAVVIGASSGVGRALAHALANAGYDLVLAARSVRDLEAVASDVEARHDVRALPLPLDIVGDDSELDAWLEGCRAALPSIAVVLIPAGIVDDDDDGVTDWKLTDGLIATNFTAVVKLASAFLGQFEARQRGTLVLFSSIATAAPRRRNVAYTAAKSALESYARSLQHRYAESEIRVQVYVLGYVDTAMTRGRRLLFPVVSPSRVADSVVDGLQQSHRLRYVPRFWASVVFVLRRLPWSVYRRLEF
jgi:decaprenylphospho-beta-D-erythro-pentofuranosid-2-ulose 2-reductase